MSEQRQPALPHASRIFLQNSSRLTEDAVRISSSHPKDDLTRKKRGAEAAARAASGSPPAPRTAAGAEPAAPAARLPPLRPAALSPRHPGRDGTGRRPPRTAEPLRPSGPPGPRARSLTVAPSQVAAPVQAEAAAVAVRGAEREPVARLEVGSARAAAGQRLSLVQLLALGRRRPAHGAAAPPAAPAPQRPGGGGGGGDEEEEEKAPSRSGDRPPAQRRGGQRRGQGPAARPDGSAPPRPGSGARSPPFPRSLWAPPGAPEGRERRSGARHGCPRAGRGLGGWRDSAALRCCGAGSPHVGSCERPRPQHRNRRWPRSVSGERRGSWGGSGRASWGGSGCRKAGSGETSSLSATL